MIKIFGKLRYHWQPELSLSIIYWSCLLTPFFFYLILLREYIRVPIPYLYFLLFCAFLMAISFRRYFVIEEGGLLQIVSVNPLRSCRIEISSIKKIEITYSSIRIFADKYPEGRTFFMRKWPKKYFINALTLEPAFQGEIVLTDHLIKQDYFEVYYSEKNKR